MSVEEWNGFGRLSKKKQHNKSIEGTAQTSHLKARLWRFPLLLEEKRVICHVDTLRWSQWEGKGAGGGGWKEGKQKGMLGGRIFKEGKSGATWVASSDVFSFWVTRPSLLSYPWLHAGHAEGKQKHTPSTLNTHCRFVVQIPVYFRVLSVWVTCGCRHDERAAGARWSVYDRKALLHVSNHAWSW